MNDEVYSHYNQIDNNKAAKSIPVEYPIEQSPKKRRYPRELEKVCYNCMTRDTPLWRRHKDKYLVCNACGLYFRSHGKERPISNRNRCTLNLRINEYVTAQFLAELKKQDAGHMKIVSRQLGRPELYFGASAAGRRPVDRNSTESADHSIYTGHFIKNGGNEAEMKGSNETKTNSAINAIGTVNAICTDERAVQAGKPGNEYVSAYKSDANAYKSDANEENSADLSSVNIKKAIHNLALFSMKNNK